MKIVEISKEPIELFKLLKFEGIASSGGEAKAMIAEGQVLLNGEVEMQKRKKLLHDDIVEIGGSKLQLRLVEPPLSSTSDSLD